MSLIKKNPPVGGFFFIPSQTISGKEYIRHCNGSDYTSQVGQQHGGYCIPCIFNSNRTKINSDNVKGSIGGTPEYGGQVTCK